MLSPEAVVLEQLRQRWLEAIATSGPVAARNNTVAVFMDRMGCSRAAAEEMVDRAWSMLNLAGHTRERAA